MIPPRVGYDICLIHKINYLSYFIYINLFIFLYSHVVFIDSLHLLIFFYNYTVVLPTNESIK